MRKKTVFKFVLLIFTFFAQNYKVHIQSNTPITISGKSFNFLGQVNTLKFNTEKSEWMMFSSGI